VHCDERVCTVASLMGGWLWERALAVISSVRRSVDRGD
jgi:hypothetical protein